jgi:hypothetical protein
VFIRNGWIRKVLTDGKPVVTGLQEQPSNACSALSICQGRLWSLNNYLSEFINRDFTHQEQANEFMEYIMHALTFSEQNLGNFRFQYEILFIKSRH